MRVIPGLAVLLALGLAPLAAAAETITIYNPSGVREDGVHVDAALEQIMRANNITKPSLANQFPRGRTEEVEIKEDVVEEINNLFYHRGWTDGLPIIPPTEERVRNMLRGSDLSGNFYISTLAPMEGRATVEKIAVNAVMAGCSPAHMPVLMTAVEAVARNEAGLRGWATTTNPDAPLLIISGPIVDDLKINSGNNSFGRGTKANAAISRAFNLILQNVGGSWPGVTDMSVLGQPGEFAMLLAENAEANPWEPFHATRGLPDHASVVTIVPVEGYSGVLGVGEHQEGTLRQIVAWMAGNDRPRRDTILLVMAQTTAEGLAGNGWTRESIVDYLRENAKVPYSVIKERFIDTNIARGVLPPELMSGDVDPDEMIPSPYFEDFIIIVSGGPGEKNMLMPTWTLSKPVSAQIRLPAFWRQLLEEEADNL